MHELLSRSQISAWQAWILATRPKTLTAGIIPVVTATALVKASQGSISWLITLSALLCSLCIQIGTNFINDALDFKKGADSTTRIGPLRATQAGLLPLQYVYNWGIAFFTLALLFGIPLILQGGWPIGILLLVSIACGYLYTGGPMPLAYHGLGDLFVLCFFGIAAVGGVYFLQTGNFDGMALLAGIQIGLLATVIIAVNNLRDSREDAKVNKSTLAVRFGARFVRIEIATFSLLPFILNLFWFYYGYVWAALLPFVILPLAIKLVKNVWQTEPSAIYNQFLAQAAAVHMGFGILLSAGFLLS